MDYGTGKKVEKVAEGPTVEAWKQCQLALNGLGLARPPLDIDGDPGPKTLAAAKELVPLIEDTIRKENK